MAILKWREKDRVKEGRWRWKREEPRSRATEHKEASPAKKSWVENSSTFFVPTRPWTLTKVNIVGPIRGAMK